MREGLVPLTKTREGITKSIVYQDRILENFCVIRVKNGKFECKFLQFLH